MAGGPIFPYSQFPVTDGETYPMIYLGDGAFEDRESMMGCSSDWTSDKVWHLTFRMPPGSLPSGTGKLIIHSRADAVTGTVVYDPQWKSVAATEDPSTGALNAETNTTATWTTAEDDIIKETKITLDADTLVAGETVHMDLLFDSTSTMAVESGHIAFIQWED